ncbi:transcription elongation factor GreA [Bacillus halotolerans]|nr:transcription elongation factor GreA [Bacillus halotolerans]MBV7318209.1 GreA/GreB family elongation factor [Halalkalibacterium halodurans]MCV0022903.1 GreA/GreB family elongation factor [Bacillus sp. XT-2]QDK66174.1 transcription elongation factor GreA [Bacillus halotolerans]QNS18908.1 GreA/GreB family elongation factor [Bacillus halotolerans]
MVDKKLLTKAGYNALKKELLFLKKKRWKEVSEKVQESRNFCDFNKDPEYQISVDEFAALKKKINDLEYIIKQAKIIKNANIREVGIGSIVTVKEMTGKYEMHLKLVSPAESHLSENYISDESPIGKSLIGHKLNDDVIVKTPSGMMHLLITEIQ